MFPSPFSYTRPTSLGDALAVLSEHRETAKLLAGGQSLLPLMKLRLAAPESLIDLGALTDLSYIRVEGDQLAIGALTRFCDLERSDLVRRECPALAHVASLVGDPQVRHRGTIGGTLAHADPASDLPTLLLALGGSVTVRNTDRPRTIVGDDLFEGFLSTVIADDEILTEVRLPRQSGPWAYEKFTRRAQEWAIIGVATVRDDQGRVRVSLANAGSTPLRGQHVEAALADGADAAGAAGEVVHDINPSADASASIEYRRHLAVTLVERALERTVTAGADDD